MATSIASGGADWMGDPHWIEQCKIELKTAIRTRFLQIKDRLDTVVYSLIRTRDFDLADELYLRLTEDGCSFEELAHFSEGPERGWGAQVGPCPLNQGHPGWCIGSNPGAPENSSNHLRSDRQPFCCG